jgi:hypothetical protein
MTRKVIYWTYNTAQYRLSRDNESIVCERSVSDMLGNPVWESIRCPVIDVAATLAEAVLDGSFRVFDEEIHE